MPARADRALLAARLTAQRLAGPPARDVVEATRRLLAIQGQDSRGARLAVRARSRSRDAADVDRALTDDRSLVITWCNRGTLHLVASEDEALLHAVTTPQLRRSSERRLAQEGVSPAAAERGIGRLTATLGADGPQTREQVRALLERARVPTAGQALIHVLFRATLDGLLVRGPMVGREHAFALREDWLGPREPIDRDRALAELARRYLAGHGPAGEADLAKWAQLPLRDVRAGFAAIAGQLEQRPDGLLELRRRRAVAPLPEPRLLGPFDPLLLGWRSRELVLPDPQQVVATNGIFKAIALVRGRAVGTWTMPGDRVALKLWNGVGATARAALERDAAAVEAYLATTTAAARSGGSGSR